MEQEVFQQRLEEDRKLVEEALHQVCQGWRRYADLTEAMEYSLLAGGKRIRPVPARLTRTLNSDYARHPSR